jgi:hypothetical protein
MVSLTPHFDGLGCVESSCALQSCVVPTRIKNKSMEIIRGILKYTNENGLLKQTSKLKEMLFKKG